jgi:hypothetical protein
VKDGKKNEDFVPSVRALSKFKESSAWNWQIIHDVVEMIAVTTNKDSTFSIKGDNVILFPLMTAAHVQAAVKWMWAHSLKKDNTCIKIQYLRQCVYMFVRNIYAVLYSN